MLAIDIKDKNSIKTTSRILTSGGFFIFPTDTVYGIGCILDEKAIRKLYKIKNRPFSQPTAILLSDTIYTNYARAEIVDKMKTIIEKYQKGKITIIVNANNFKIKFPKILLKDNKIGFRIPADKWLEKLIDIVGPIVTSSANLAGDATPKKFSDINPKLLEHVDLVIKSNKISSNSPSTVYDIETNKIIRN